MATGPNRRGKAKLLTVLGKIYYWVTYGEVAEWFNAAVLKTVVGATPPRVRISASPPIRKKAPFMGVFFVSDEES